MKKLSLLSLAAVGALILTGCGKDGVAGTKLSAEKFKDYIDEKLPEHLAEALEYGFGSVDVRYSFVAKTASLGGLDLTEKGKVSYKFNTETMHLDCLDEEFTEDNYACFNYVDDAVREISLWTYVGDNMSKEDFVAQFGAAAYSLYVNPYRVTYNETYKSGNNSQTNKAELNFNSAGFCTKYVEGSTMKISGKSGSYKVVVSLSWTKYVPEE